MNPQQNQFVLSMLGYAVQRELPVEQLCRNLKLDLNKLRSGKGVAVTKHQMAQLWNSLLQSSGDPLFGLHFGESLQLTALGAVGEIIKHSATVGEALTYAAAMIPNLTDLYTMEIIKSKKNFVVQYSATQNIIPSDVIPSQVADFLMVFTIHELDGLLLKRVDPLTITYPYPLQNSSEYERVLRVRPKKGKGHSIEFPIEYWQEQIFTANSDVKNYLLKKYGLDAKFEADKFKDQVYNYLITNSYLAIHSVTDVAANFNTTTRSLQRKLKNEGTTFHQLVEDVKKDLALNYLKANSYELKEISYMLGYNELSAFYRAFKRWTGKAPGRYEL